MKGYWKGDIVWEKITENLGFVENCYSITGRTEASFRGCPGKNSKEKNSGKDLL